MIAYYNSQTKRIIAIVEADSPDVEPPKNEGVPLYLDDVQYTGIRNDLANYVIENDLPVYSALPPNQPQSPEPTIEERTSALEDAVTVLMGL